MVLSHPTKLQIEFTPGGHDHALGFGYLRVNLGKSSIWSDGEERGIGWTWIDVLEQLARAWPFLKYEESTPPRTYDSTLSLLRSGHLAATDFDFEPATESTRDAYVFLRRHNLATGVEGLYLPSFSLLREGQKVWVASTYVAKLIDLEPTLQTLAQLGDDLAANIASGVQQDRSRLAIEAWKNREPTLDAVLRIKLGPGGVSEMVPPGQSIASYLEAENDDHCESSLLVAARMSEAVPRGARSTILELLRARPAVGESQFLNQISAEAEAQLPDYVQRAHQQGEILAKWARSKFGIAPDAKADPQEVLRSLGVDVTLHRFGIEMIDAVGCWSNRHGPAVLVNMDGKHAQSVAGRRATLAHELAHVLVDRNGSLPAAEVFGGNVPRYPEQRANAFAAEFLLPKSVAVERISKASDAAKAIDHLREQFAVSRELAAWQILNSRAINELEDHEKWLLRSWTSNSNDSWFFS